jgi:hypothetical protein
MELHLVATGIAQESFSSNNQCFHRQYIGLIQGDRDLQSPVFIPTRNLKQRDFAHSTFAQI